MQIDRSIGNTPQSRRLRREILALGCPCIGCPGCRGACRALLDLLSVPGIVLDGEQSA